MSPQQKRPGLTRRRASPSTASGCWRCGSPASRPPSLPRGFSTRGASTSSSRRSPSPRATCTTGGAGGVEATDRLVARSAGADGAVLTVGLADDFFVYPATHAVLDLTFPAVDLSGVDHGFQILIEELAFYVLGFASLLTLGAWADAALFPMSRALGIRVFPSLGEVVGACAVSGARAAFGWVLQRTLSPDASAPLSPASDRPPPCSSRAKATAGPRRPAPPPCPRSGSSRSTRWRTRRDAAARSRCASTPHASPRG